MWSRFKAEDALVARPGDRWFPDRAGTVFDEQEGTGRRDHRQLDVLPLAGPRRRRSSRAKFWAEVDGFVTARERRYLVAADAGLPTPQDTASHLVSPTAWRETAQLHLHDGTTEDDRAELAALLERAATELPGPVRARPRHGGRRRP
jgi:hypothetical protein